MPLSELEISDLTKRFGSMTAVDAFHLRVAGQEFVTLLGPSGCGKSTVLYCISGLLPLTTGSISLDGQRIDGVPAEKRNFGIVFQNYALFPHLSVFRNVAFGLELRGRPRAEITERVRQALGIVQLEGVGEKYPGQLSGGQQQRVAIARTLVLEPRLLLMDEPLSNLDAKLRAEMRGEIKRLHQRLGLTTIYVTHDQSEALSLSDRIVVMRNGQIQQVGEPEEIYSQPRNLFVADFMGYRNRFPARLLSRDGDRVRVAAEGWELTGLPASGERLDQAAHSLTVAIHPDAFQTGEGPVNTVRAAVDLVEYLGQHQHVEAVLPGGQRVELRTTEPVRPGDTLAVWVPPERVAIFAE